MFKNASIRLKIIAVCAFLATLTCVTGAVSYMTAQQVQEEYSEIANVSLPDAQMLTVMMAAFKEIRISLRTLGLPGLTKEAKRQAIESVKEHIAEFEKKRMEYESLPFPPEEHEVYDPMVKAWVDFQAVGARILQIAESNPPDASAQLERLYMNECPAAAIKFEAEFDKLMDFHAKDSKRIVERATATKDAGELTVIALSIGSFVLALIVSFVFSASLSRTLAGLAAKLAEGASQVANASGEISASGADLSSSTTEQAAALQETVASVDEVSAMVSKNADNAKRSQAVADASHQAALRGKKDMDQMQRSIEEINHSNNDIMRQTESSNQDIANIVKVIAEIGNKTKVINDIVFQTKLLSFNASVEAARAGEHGKGFAVVAEEVGNLAQMSGNAAKEISQMLEESIRKVETTVTESKTKIERLIVASKDKVEVGMGTARRCGDALDEIVRNVSDLNHMVAEISTASQEQAQGVQEINKAMGQLDQVTQQNAAGAQQAASASNSLKSQAAVLNGLVESLVATVQGAGRQPGKAAGVTQASPASTTAITDSQVIAINRSRTATKPSLKPVANVSQKKMVMGSDIAPSEDDSRFEDI